MTDVAGINHPHTVSNSISWIVHEVQIEADQSRAGGLLDNVYGLVAYLLQPGATIGDGDTFGGPAAGRISIRHAESLYTPGVPIFAATLEARQA
jgi:hypothetical protein